MRIIVKTAIISECATWALLRVVFDIMKGTTLLLDTWMTCNGFC